MFLLSLIKIHNRLLLTATFMALLSFFNNFILIITGICPRGLWPHFLRQVAMSTLTSDITTELAIYFNRTVTVCYNEHTVIKLTF